MSLSVSDLKDALLSSTEGATDSELALTDFGTAIADYIKDNAEVSFSWSAALPVPPNTTDPVTEASGEIVSLSFSLTPSQAENQVTAINFLKTQLITGLTAATYNITDSGFTTAPGLMSSSPNLSSLSLSVSGDSRETAMEQLATSIIDWVKDQAPALPCAGSRNAPPVYVGAGTVTGIS